MPVVAPRLKGEALNCFIKHTFDKVIQTRLGSISRRTRNNRRFASKFLWRYLLASSSLVRAYNRFIVPYPLIMGRLVYEGEEAIIERLFGYRRFVIPAELYRSLLERRRLPLFTELSTNGFDKIDNSWDVPAQTFTWRCPRISAPSYSLDRYNPHVNKFHLESSTLALEWTFDLLHSINRIFPSIKNVHLGYYHLPQANNDLLSCFLQEHKENPGFTEFVSNLKIDQLTIEQFIDGISQFISQRMPNVQFWIDIIWPAEGCQLVANSKTAKIMRNAHGNSNLRIDLFKISPAFNLLRK